MIHTGRSHGLIVSRCTLVLGTVTKRVVGLGNNLFFVLVGPFKGICYRLSRLSWTYMDQLPCCMELINSPRFVLEPPGTLQCHHHACIVLHRFNKNMQGTTTTQTTVQSNVFPKPSTRQHNSRSLFLRPLMAKSSWYGHESSCMGETLANNCAVHTKKGVNGGRGHIEELYAAPEP